MWADEGTGNRSIRRIDVLGVQVSAVDLARAMTEIGRWITQSERTFVTLTGVHGVMECQRNPELLEIHNRAGMVAPDGMPLVWAARYAGCRETARVYGPDLLLATCERAAREGWRSFFYGGAPGVAEELAVRLQDRFPGLVVAGTFSPPFRSLTTEESTEIVGRINDSRADLVWVGLSTPKQERWMGAHRSVLQAPVLLGVGAAFDFHAGRVRQAPSWMQRSGLEWVFRLAVEPRRLWRRYLRNNPAFVARIVRRPPRIHVAPTEQRQGAVA